MREGEDLDLDNWLDERYSDKVWRLLVKIEYLMRNRLGWTGVLHDEAEERYFSFLDWLREEYVIPTFQDARFCSDQCDSGSLAV